MDEATVSSSWKLLPWLILGGSSKKTRLSKRVSAYKRRLQAHAAVARSLSPFCARTSFTSPALSNEENKCLLSLSAFMSVCGHCALRDVQVALAPIHSPHQQKAYIKAIHRHLQEPSLQHHTKAPLSRKAHYRATSGGGSHTEKAHTSREEDSVHQRDHHYRYMAPPKTGDAQRSGKTGVAKKSGAYECNEIAIKPSRQDKPRQLKQYLEGEVIARGKSRHNKYGKLRRELEVYSFDTGDIWHSHQCTPATSSSSSSSKQGVHRLKVPSLDGHAIDQTEHASHGTKASSTSSKKCEIQSETCHGKGSSVKKKAAQNPPNLEAGLYVCTTAGVLQQHKGKLKVFEEGVMSDYGYKHPLWKSTHRYKIDDPSLKTNNAGTELPLKIKHISVEKGSETFLQACEDPPILKQTKSYKIDALKEWANQHTSKDVSVSGLSLKNYHDSKEWPAGKDPLSVKCSESFTFKDPSMPFRSGHTFSYTEPLTSKDSDICAYMDPSPLKSTDSRAKNNLSSKLAASPVYEGNQGNNKAAKASKKIKHMRPSHHHDKVSGGIWMQDTLPVVKYSHNPYKDFHSSMLEMLLERGLKDFHELQDMFVCYVLLNSPCNQKYIEKAFRDLLTDLYKCKLMKSLQVEEMQLAKTEDLSSH